MMPMPQVLPSLPAQGGLPHSEESERAVLAACLLDSRLLPVVSGRLTEEDFYDERHRVIYNAMVDVQDDGDVVDLRTLQAKLEQKDQLAATGGIAYLATLDLDLPDLGRVDTYVELVKERSVRRRLILASSAIARDCLDGGVDAQEALARAEQAILGLGEEAIQRGFTPMARVLHAILEDLEENPGQTLLGLPSGFLDLDRMTHGFHPGNLVIVAGRPGMGKTSLALNIAQYVALQDRKSVGMFSLEMSDNELTMRILCSEAGVPFSRVRSGHLSKDEWHRIHDVERRVEGSPLYIDDSPSPNLLEVSSKARRLKAEHGLELIIVDYLQLMQAGGKYENRNLEIAAISRGLKQLAKELEIPVLALSQLSRQPERRGSDHRPQLADLRESGAIEQDADMVCFVYRDEIYHPDDEDNHGLAELIIAKHRNGETGTVHLVFLGETTTFKNRARDAYDYS
jgi:replicative DNA helicase